MNSEIIQELKIILNQEIAPIHLELSKVNQRLDKIDATMATMDDLNNGLNSLKSYVQEGFKAVDERFEYLENEMKTANKRLNLIDKNLVKPYDFQSLALRVEKLESK